MVFAVLALCAGMPAHADTYSYDANGRLRAVTDASGDSSQYNYDALGNLLSIITVPAGQLAIFSFLPNHGPAGTSVTIQGQGFSTAASGNNVAFNGTVALVTSATANQLVGIVPVGASTGPISVFVGSATATSADAFVVTGDSGGAPTISSFSPAVANAGTSVTVNGDGFVTTAGPTQAGVNLETATVTPASSTQLTFPVPAMIGSGPVTVSTPYGTAQSAQPLIVVPTSVGVSNVITTAQLTAGAAPTALSIGTANKYAVAAFQGIASQWLSLQFSQLTTAPAAGRLNISVYDPSGQDIYNASIANLAQQSNDMSAHLAQLALTGTYTLIVTPASGATASFSVALQSDPMINPATHMIPITVSVPGQTQRAIYQATDGANIGIGMSNFTLVPSGGGNAIGATMYAAVGYAVPGALAICGSPGNFQCNGWAGNLAAGFYGVVVGTYFGSVQTFSTELWVTPDATGTITIGTPATIATNYPGQQATYTFHGSAGELMNLALINVKSDLPFIDVSVLDPNGNCVLASTSCPTYSANQVAFDALVPLLLTGTYSIVVNPGDVSEAQALTGSISATFSQTATATLPLDVTGGTQVTTTVEGQQSQLVFQVTHPGDNLGFGMTNTVASPIGTIEADIFDPNGNVIASPFCRASGYPCSATLRGLAVGTYKIVFKPSDTRTQAFSTKIYLSHDVTGTLAVGTPTTIATTLPGQNATYTFQGTAGQQLNLAVDQIVRSQGINYLSYSITDPNDNCVLGFQTSTHCPQTVSGTTYQGLVTLPSTGTYTVFVQPLDQGLYQAGTVSGRFTLSRTTTATLPLDVAGGTAVATTAEGQNLQYTFTVTTPGDNLGLGLTNVVVTPSGSGGYVIASVENAAGTQVGSVGCLVPGYYSCSTGVRNLAPGTYTLTLAPGDTRTQTFSATLYLTHDVTGTLTLGTPTTIATSVPGQNATYTFQATAGQNLTLAFSQVVSGPDSWYLNTQVFNPANSSIGNYSIEGTTTETLTAPTTGTYTLYINPLDLGYAAITASLQVDITAN